MSFCYIFKKKLKKIALFLGNRKEMYKDNSEEVRDETI